MTCAHPPGRVACERCHSFRAVRACPVCGGPEADHIRARTRDGTTYIGCPALAGQNVAYVMPPPDDKR